MWLNQESNCDTTVVTMVFISAIVSSHHNVSYELDSGVVHDRSFKEGNLTENRGLIATVLYIIFLCADLQWIVFVILSSLLKKYNKKATSTSVDLKCKMCSNSNCTWQLNLQARQRDKKRKSLVAIRTAFQDGTLLFNSFVSNTFMGVSCLKLSLCTPSSKMPRMTFLCAFKLWGEHFHL